MSLDADLDAYKEDNKFKNYVSECNLTLQLFEKAKEWPDLINCLRKMYRVLNKYSQFKEYIPEKNQFCKRLAQCCNPSLPSGVHAKVLEIYKVIFKRIGPVRLARDLPIYSIGIFPLFANTSIQIKLIILQIFEEFYIPLEQDLNSCLYGFLIAIFPALEDVNTDYYFKAIKILELLSKKVDETMFYYSVWKCISSNSVVRLGAIRYLIENIPPSKSDDNISVYIPKPSSIVVQALRTSLNSNSVLVQRSTLDLLLTHFLVSSSILMDCDYAIIIHEALKILTKNDASLNRRIVSWASENLKNSKHSFLQSLDLIFDVKNADVKDVLLSIDIALYLLDYSEIITHVTSEITDHVINTLSVCSKGNNQDVIVKVFKFISTMKFEFFWSHLGHRIANTNNFDTYEKLEFQVNVFDVLLDNISILNASFFSVNTILKILLSTTENFISNNIKNLSKLVELILKIWSVMKDNYINLNADNGLTKDEFSHVYLPVMTEDIVLFKNFYTAFINKVLLEKSLEVSEENSVNVEYVFYQLSSLLIDFYSTIKLDLSSDLKMDECVQCLINVLEIKNINAVLLALKTLTQLLELNISNSLKNSNLLSVQSKCFKTFWSLLERYNLVNKGDLVKLFVTLDKLFPEICGNIMYELVNTENLELKSKELRNFTILWKLTEEFNCLKSFNSIIFLMLDYLDYNKSEFLRLMAKSWLLNSVSKIDRILDPILLLMIESLTEKVERPNNTEYDYRRVIYLFHILENLIGCDKNLILTHLMHNPLTDSIDKIVFIYKNNSNGQFSLYSKLPINNYLEFLIVNSLCLIYNDNNAESDDELYNKDTNVQSKAINFLDFLFLSISDSLFVKDWFANIKKYVLDILHRATTNNLVILEVKILSLIYTLFSRNRLDDETTKYVVTSNLFLSTIDSGLTKNCKNFIFDFYWLNFVITCLPYLVNNSDFPVHLLLLLGDLMTNEVNENLFTIYKILNSFKLIIKFILDLYKNGGFEKDPVKNHNGIIQTLFKNIFSNSSNSVPKTVDGKLLDPVPNILWKNMNALTYNIFEVWCITKNIPDHAEGSVIDIQDLEKNFNDQIIDILIEILDLLFESSPMYFLHSILEQWNYFTNNLNAQLEFKSKKELAEILKRMKVRTSIIESLNKFSENLKNNSHSNENTNDTSLFKVDIKNLSFVSPKKFRLCNSLKLENDALSELFNIKSSKFKTSINFDEYLEKYKKADSAANLYDVSIFEILLSIIDWQDIDTENMLSSLLSLISTTLNSNNPTITLISLVLMGKLNVSAKNLTKFKKTINVILKKYLDLLETFFEADLNERQNFFRCLLLIQELTKNLNIWNKFNDDNKNSVNLHFAQLIKLLFPLVFTSNEVISFKSTVLIEKIVEDAVCDIKLLKRQILDRLLWENTKIFSITNLKQMKLLTNIIGIFFDKNDALSQEYIKLITQSQASSNLFSNQIFLVPQKVQYIKILGLILLSGKKDQYLNYLPMIQEKLAETLRNRDNNTSLIYNVFLCFQVLILRFNDTSLRSFWPVIISEMINIFEVTNSPEYMIPVIKFINLVSILNIEQFNLYKWMFISDSFNIKTQQLNFVPFIDLLVKPAESDNSESLIGDVNNPYFFMECKKSDYDLHESYSSKNWEILKKMLSLKKSYQYFNNVMWLSSSDYTKVDNLVLKDFFEEQIESKNTQQVEAILKNTNASKSDLLEFNVFQANPIEKNVDPECFLEMDGLNSKDKPE